MTRSAAPWRLALAFALGATLPWLAESVRGGLASMWPEFPYSAAVSAWTTVIIAAALALTGWAQPRPAAVAGAAALGGWSALAIVAVLYRLPLAWVLGMWPQLLALGVALPVAVLALASLGRRRS